MPQMPKEEPRESATQSRRQRTDSIIAHLQLYGSNHESRKLSSALFDLFHEALETATGASGLEDYSTGPLGYDSSDREDAKEIDREVIRHTREIRANAGSILIASAIMYAGQTIAEAIESVELHEHDTQ